MNEQALVAPVWWDPKNRKLIFDGTTFVPGVLLATRHRFVLLAPDGVYAQGALRGATGTRSSLETRLGAMASASVQLTLADGRYYKIYFSHPHRAAPRLSKRESEEIADMIDNLADRGSAVADALDVSSLADFAEFAHFAGAAIKSFSAVAEARQGGVKADEFIERIAAATAAV